MPNYTIAQLRTVGVNPATTDLESLPGFVMIEYVFDGTKRSTVANDTVDIFEVPPFASLRVLSAGVTVVTPGTATGTLSITLGAAAAAGTAVTGLTAWANDAAAGTRLIKYATVAAAQDITSTTTSNFVKLQCVTAGFGSALIRVRVFGFMTEAPPVTS